MSDVFLMVIGVILVAGLIVVGSFVFFIRGHIKTRKEELSISEILKLSGIEGEYREWDRLGQFELTMKGRLEQMQVGLDTYGENLISGQYSWTKFESASTEIRLEYFVTDLMPQRYYCGRVTIMYPGTDPAMTLLLIRKQFTKGTIMKDQRSSELVITNGLTKFTYDKDEIHIDPEWDSKWITYTDNIEKSSQMFASGSVYRKKLLASQLDFILWTEKKIIFGSQNGFYFERRNRINYPQDISDSLVRIREDLDEVLMYCP